VVEVEGGENSEESDDDDENNSDLENAYLGKKRPNKPTAPSAGSEDEVEGNESIDSDAEESDPDAPPPVHESLTKRVRTKPAKKTKVVPEGETSVQRNARTLFIGGLPVEVAQKKVCYLHYRSNDFLKSALQPLQKQLSRHILSFLPSSSKIKIESMRFRSVAFRDPTSSTALSSSTTPESTSVNANSVPVPAASNHSKARASTWRQSGSAADEKSQAEADGDAKKEYLTPAQKKKILFIQGALHPEANAVNAYVVLAPHTSDAPGADDPDSPYNVALHIARTANSADFMERTLRVDVCARLPDAVEADGTGPSGDPKLSIFLGNLDFGSRESDVREFFEGVVAGERGPAPASEDGSVGRWVQGVRLIRDRETQLGKGFGYVHFVVCILVLPSPNAC
jgi:nucleolar protein 12